MSKHDGKETGKGTRTLVTERPISHTRLSRKDFQLLLVVVIIEAESPRLLPVDSTCIVLTTNRRLAETKFNM
jgi:hypothetical protein